MCVRSPLTCRLPRARMSSPKLDSRCPSVCLSVRASDCLHARAGYEPQIRARALLAGLRSLSLRKTSAHWKVAAGGDWRSALVVVAGAASRPFRSHDSRSGAYSAALDGRMRRLGQLRLRAQPARLKSRSRCRLKQQQQQQRLQVASCARRSDELFRKILSPSDERRKFLCHAPPESADSQPASQSISQSVRHLN